MKLVCTLLLLALALPLAAEQKARKKNSPRAASKAKAPEQKLPPDAVEIAPNTYSHTDKQGRKWIYRQMPFGLQKYEEGGAASAAAASSPLVAKYRDADDYTTAVEDGDVIRFERAMPFGKSRWERKKSELNEAEQAVWNRELARRAEREAPKTDAAESSKPE